MPTVTVMSLRSILRQPDPGEMGLRMLQQDHRALAAWRMDCVPHIELDTTLSLNPSYGTLIGLPFSIIAILLVLLICFPPCRLVAIWQASSN